tara:strand:- start:364 stop:555 length:192 start_codon:yes stop_codon:yes gene_type:complete
MQTKEYNKEQVANLERQKIVIKDQLEFTTDVKRIIELEEQLFEVQDTIFKLTNPIKTHEEKTN